MQVVVAGKEARVYVFPDDAPAPSAAGAGGAAPAPRPSTHRYSFQIGSVESFERHLEDAQRAFDWPPETHVPVVYVNPEISFLDEALKFAPTLLLIGALIWTTRSTMRGMGGGGMGGKGGRNIFNVGKAQVRDRSCGSSVLCRRGTAVPQSLLHSQPHISTAMLAHATRGPARRASARVSLSGLRLQRPTQHGCCLRAASCKSMHVQRYHSHLAARR